MGNKKATDISGMIECLKHRLTGLPNSEEQQLRQSLEEMERRKPEGNLYPILLRLLDKKALVMRWSEHEGKPIREWSSNRAMLDSEDYDLIEAVYDPNRAPNIAQWAVLYLLVNDSLVFTTDIDVPADISFIVKDRGVLKNHLASLLRDH